MSVKKYAMMTAMIAAMSMGMYNGGYSDNTIRNGVNKRSNPWDKINLSKEQRRGKSFDEIQAMRKSIYEASIA